MLTPYPLIYCPKGTPKPACCAHAGGLTAMAGHGCDYDAETKTGGGGTVYGGTWQTSPHWKQTRAGWWVLMQGHRPQDLLRTGRHPRILRRRWVEGAFPEHKWSVPVLLEFSGDSYRPAIDGIWDGQGWSQGDLEPLFRALMCLANDTPLAATMDSRNDAMRDMAISLLSVDQWVDEPFLATAGWLSQRLMMETVLAAVGARGTEMAGDKI